MRILKFIVDGQNIRIDPNCDIDGLVPGTNGYLEAHFSFSEEWKNTVKVVGFYSRLGKEYTPKLLNDGKSCVIPAEALQKRFFKLRVIGQNGLVTNKFMVDQKGGRV